MPITEAQKARLQELVSARIEQLELLLGREHQGQPRRKGDDESANLDITINSTVESQILDSATIELERLKAKRAWLASDDAGHCVRCDCDIPYARLEASLGTRLCINCAEDQGE